MNTCEETKRPGRPRLDGEIRIPCGISLPLDLVQSIEKLATAMGINRSEFCSRALKEYLDNIGNAAAGETNKGSDTLRAN